MSPPFSPSQEEVLSAANAAVDELSQRLGAARKEAGLSQEEVAELAGVSRATVVRIESPGTSVTLLNAALVAQALECKLTLAASDAGRLPAMPPAVAQALTTVTEWLGKQRR